MDQKPSAAPWSWGRGKVVFFRYLRPIDRQIERVEGVLPVDPTRFTPLDLIH